MFALHILLAVGIAAFSNALNPMGVVGAFVLIYLVLKLGGRLILTGNYMQRLELGVGFIMWFFREVVLASIHVAKIVTARKVNPSPAIVKVRLEDKREEMATLLGLLLTLTPGTMALDYDAETGDMLIHVLNAESVEDVERGLREIERRLLDWMYPDRLKAATPGDNTCTGEKT